MFYNLKLGRLLCRFAGLSTCFLLAFPISGAAQSGEEARTRRFEATVSPERVLELRAGVGGRVVALDPSFVEGGMLAGGDTAVTIEPLPFRLAVARARSALKEAALAYELELAESEIAQETLAGGDTPGGGRLASRALHVDFREAALAEARLRVSLAEQDLDEASIVAPFAALVVDEAVEEGSVVRPEDRLARLLSTQTALVRIPVPASLQPRFDALAAEGTAVTVISAAGAARAARLIGSERTVNPRTQTIFYQIRLEDPYDLSGKHGNSIPFGASVSVEVTLGEPADARAAAVN